VGALASAPSRRADTMREFLGSKVVAKLDALTARVRELTAATADPAVLSRPERMSSIQRELGSLRGVADRYVAFRKGLDELAELDALLADPASDADLRGLAAEEEPGLAARLSSEAEALLDLLLATEGDGDRSAVVEIRAGTGGEEAALFARDLRDLYARYCERAGLQVEVLSESESDLGGFREVVLLVHGVGAFHRLRFESGGHRVQRVPATESQGRIHTSAATVAVLPEAEEVDLEIREADLEMQAVRASGPGGQNVNKVSSAVRLTHVPSGMSVFCQEERSQHKNRAKALKLLRTRLLDIERQKVDAARAADRRSQVGTGDRNARVRTYNFPQNRLTDHRLGQNFPLEPILEGKLEPVVEALLALDREQRIAAL
jgi:peptide chain release factor 1